MTSGGGVKYSGSLDCAMWIQRNEGFLAFWKSNFVNCLRYFPTQALNFTFKGQLKNIQALKKQKGDGYVMSLARNIMAGGMAGGGSLAFVYSLDYARTRLSNDLKASKKAAKAATGDSSKAIEGAAKAGAEAAKGGAKDGRDFTGLIDVYRKTLAADGIAGLYRGFVISFVGIFIYRGLYFGLYDTIMPMFPENSTGLTTRFAVGYCVTVVAGLASYPIDTIRRRMMMTSGGGVKYSGSLDCARQIMAKEGLLSFFKGADANILRGVAGAGVLSLFDTVVEAYVGWKFGPGYVAQISGGGG